VLFLGSSDVAGWVLCGLVAAVTVGLSAAMTLHPPSGPGQRPVEAA
jgi:hypothetical protein